MNRRIRPTLVALAVSLAAPALGQQAVNPIHPVFAPLDAAGHPTRAAGAISVERTCGACHDAAYIAAHSRHAGPAVTATCVQCHVDGGALDVRAETLDAEGRLVRAAIRIGAPRAASCGRCHGLISDGAAPVAIPPDYSSPGGAPGRTLSLTQGEGAIVAPQRMADSFLDLQGKAKLESPWDVHAAKLVDCVACHYASNNPGRVAERHTALRYLTDDPRRATTAEFLVRPDHRFVEQGCRSCHDALQAHEFLPYRSRHMTVLACQACHVAAPMGLALEMVDATVVTTAGKPVVRYRNASPRPGESLNAATIRPFRPLLVERQEQDGVTRLAPVNTVSRFRWISGATRAEVPPELVARAYLEGNAYAPAVLERFDANHDGRLEESELRLDSRRKADLVAGRLAVLGVVDPVIEGTLDTYPLGHGVPSRDRALRDCSECHSGDSRMSARFVVAGYLPGGTPPRPREGSRVELAGVLTPGEDGSLVLERDREAAPGKLHVLGHSREGLTNTLGFALFVAVFLGVAAHGLVRFVLRKARTRHAHADGGRAYVFGRYERLWHWTMALSGVLLIVSGLEIHSATPRWLIDLPRAVSLHNVFAVLLMLNAFLALFYHLTTRAIRNFIPEPHGFLARALEHMAYQSRGIFFGGPHPTNAPGHKLNPLQQVTYLALLNVLFPLQIVTGLLIWAVGHWPDVATALGGLHYVAPLHNAGSWLFLSFFVLHVYLVTTGRTPTEHLESMITGYQAVDPGEVAPERS